MTRTPELTRRDAGELKNYKPRIYITPLTWEIKRLWAEGHKQGKIAKMTGAKKDYVKKATACFSRALTLSPTGDGEAENPEIQVQVVEKKHPKKPTSKNRKSLTLNFSAPIAARSTLVGVTKVRGRGWKAQIRVGKTVRYLGVYDTVQEAAEVYDKEAKRVFGKYTNNLNEI